MKRFEKGARRKGLWNDWMELSDEVELSEDEPLFVGPYKPPAEDRAGEASRSGRSGLRGER